MTDKKNTIDPTGQHWSPAEVDLIVSAYFDMLSSELSNKPYVKAQRNRNLQSATGRSKGSIEFKFQNISAVLTELGLPRILGYVPMANYQRALLEAIERFLSVNERIFSKFEAPNVTGFGDEEGFFLEPPPLPRAVEPAHEEALERLVRKFDPAIRDERNRALGKRGEELVLHFERRRLIGKRPDLAEKVRWVSQLEGDGAGFDILSFELNGSERLIEVKTTIGHETTPFYISANELALSDERPGEFRLMRIYDFARKPRAFELTPPLTNSVLLAPQTYRASFQ